MFNFFDSIAVFLRAAVDFLINGLKSLLDLVEAVPRMITFLFASFAYLPPFVRSFCFIVISLAVVYLFAGRKGDA